MSSIAAGYQNRGTVLADLVPAFRESALVRDAVLVSGGAALTGLAAQIAIPIPGSPVLLTFQTFAALTVGAALGWRRGGLAMLLYLAVGALGVPWFSAGTSGMTSASAGYIIGMVFAATLVGAVAARGGDRTVPTTIATMIAGNVLIYAAGVPWLMAAAGLDFPQALLAGVVPFLIGDAIKIVISAGALPTAWALVRRSER